MMVSNNASYQLYAKQRRRLYCSHGQPLSTLTSSPSGGDVKFLYLNVVDKRQQVPRMMVSQQ